MFRFHYNLKKSIRTVHIWDMVRTEKTLQVDSFDEGMAKGRAEGELTKSLDIARKMLASGLPASQITEFTGLSKEQLGQLK